LTPSRKNIYYSLIKFYNFSEKFKKKIKEFNYLISKKLIINPISISHIKINLTLNNVKIFDTYHTFHNIALEKLEIPDITIIHSPSDAIRAVNILKTVKNR